MAKDTRWTKAVRTLQANSIDQEFDDGYLRIYDGSRPAGPSTAITGQVLLAELRFAATAVASESNGVLTFDTITADSSANATGTATWARCLKSDGTTAICDLEVGTGTHNVVLPTTSITIGVEVAISSMTVTVAATSIL
jgi:hypothetical protein